jgi:hypothetical protein
MLILSVFSIIGLILGIIGTGIMAKGLLLNDETIDRISGTYVGENPHFKEKLREDRRDAKIGLILLGMGFGIQFISEISSLILSLH